MQKTAKRRWIALTGGIVCALILWLFTSREGLSGAIANLSMASAAAVGIYLILRSNDVNEVQINLSADETHVGRTPQYFYFRENSWLWYIKRNPFPLGGSVIVTTRRIMFYYGVSWYDEILLKDLIAIEWTEAKELNFRYRQGGVEKGMRVMTLWGAYDLLVQLFSQIGVTVSEMPRKVGTTS